MRWGDPTLGCCPLLSCWDASQLCPKCCIFYSVEMWSLIAAGHQSEIQCLDWMEPSGSFVPQFLSSACAHTPFLPPSISPSPVLCLLFSFHNHLLNILSWPRKVWTKGRQSRIATEQKGEKNDNWMDASLASLSLRGMTVLPLSSYSTNNCIFQNTSPFPFVCAQDTPSRGISSAMNDRLFQTPKVFQQ